MDMRCKTAEMFHVEHIPFQNILQMGKIKERVTDEFNLKNLFCTYIYILWFHQYYEYLCS